MVERLIEKGEDAMKKIIAAIIVLSIAFFISGCSALAQKDIGRVQAAHGVGIEITSAAAVAGFMGGNSLVTLRNVDKELQLFPYQAKKGIKIHIGAATQDRPGQTQGDIYVLNKDLWGTYMDPQEPGNRNSRFAHSYGHLLVPSIASLQ